MHIAATRRSIAATLCACALSAPTVSRAEDPADWLPTPEGLRRMADYFPFETVARGDAVYELEWGEPLGQDGPGGLDLEAFNRENLSTGMLVLHEGRIVYEGYWLGADAESHFASWSMAKSITGTLIGIAAAEGSIRSIEDPIVRYVPELTQTAYRDVTIEQALQMSSGVEFNESYYGDPESQIMTLTCLMLPPGPPFADCARVIAEFSDMQGLLLSLDERAAPPGAIFNYSTAESHVLGWVLQNATGRSPAEYLSEKIWQPLGMEDDATWLLDHPGGTTLTGAAFNARLRDYARLGLLMLNDGMLDGKRILPEGWVERATTPSKRYLEHLDPQVFGYQYQWWVVPDGLVVPNGSGAFEAQGLQGQFLYIDPQHALVVALTSAWPGPIGWDVERAMAFHDTLGSIVRALGYAGD